MPRPKIKYYFKGKVTTLQELYKKFFDQIEQPTGWDSFIKNVKKLHKTYLTEDEVLSALTAIKPRHGVKLASKKCKRASIEHAIHVNEGSLLTRRWV